MRYSPRGRAIYATGGNAEAARLCGVDPRRTTVMVFALHGFFAGVAAASFTAVFFVFVAVVVFFRTAGLFFFSAAAASSPDCFGDDVFFAAIR